MSVVQANDPLLKGTGYTWMISHQFFMVRQPSFFVHQATSTKGLTSRERIDFSLF